jgi:virginiamycin A acetyltransferase
LQIIEKIATKLFCLTKKRKIRQLLLSIIIKYDNSLLENTRDVMLSEYNITIGKRSYGCFSLDENIEPGTFIGSYCSIAMGVVIGNMNHPIKFISTHPFLYDARFGLIEDSNEEVLREGTKPVIINNNVWIGRNAIIMPGIVVGKGSVIAAGAVVTKNVEPYSIVGGVPAKLLKKRFTDEEIEKLLKIDWENWEDDKLKKEIKSFNNIEEFLNRHS